MSWPGWLLRALKALNLEFLLRWLGGRKGGSGPSVTLGPGPSRGHLSREVTGGAAAEAQREVEAAPSPSAAPPQAPSLGEPGESMASAEEGGFESGDFGDGVEPWEEELAEEGIPPGSRPKMEAAPEEAVTSEDDWGDSDWEREDWEELAAPDGDDGLSEGGAFDPGDSMGGGLATGGGPFTMAEAGRDQPAMRGGRSDSAPPTGPPATPAMVTHERVPHMDLTPAPAPAYAPGDRFAVEVYVDRKAFRSGESGDGVTFRAPAGQRRFPLEVWLVAHPDYFEVVGPTIGTFELDLDAREPRKAHFEVRVRDDAPTAAGVRLSASFSVDGRPSGRVERRVDVVAAGASLESAAAAGTSIAEPEASPSAPGFSDLLQDAALGAAGGEVEDAPPPARMVVSPGVAADLVVRVVALDASGQRYTCRVQSDLLPDYTAGQEGDWELPQSTDRLVVDKMKDFSKKGVNAFFRRTALQGAGEAFFDAAPQVFRDAFWRLVDERPGQLRTLAIVSDEPHVPWELMIPTRDLPSGEHQERRPLGVEFILSRWTARDHVLPPQALPLTHSYVVAPADSGLKKAEAEADMVLASFAGERVAPASMESLNDFLDRRGTALLHFICHGLSRDGKQVLQLEQREELPAYFLRGMPGVEKGLASERPLVFLNACQVGRQEAGLVGPEGFAQAFMALGAGGVVAALWSVKDDLANELATKFYERVKAEPKTPFAEILRDLRARSYEGSEAEDTWAAYCFYGDPLAARCPPSRPSR